MGIFDKLKQGLNSILGSLESENKTSATPTEPTAPAAPSAPAEPDYNPKGKPLEWFSSEEGMESCKKHTTPQNFMLEVTYMKEFEKKNPNEPKYDDISFPIFLQVYHNAADAMLPCFYFKALANAIKVQPLQIRGVFEWFIDFMKIMAQPFTINDDGEPEACQPLLTPEEIVSVEKNPLLNFVKNFDVFVIEDDELGSAADKYALYWSVMKFLAATVRETVIEENQWLFDKGTYLNDFGTVRKRKGFLKQCKELSNFPEYFDVEISKLDK